jgi:DNA-binding response OmpR family regulator
VDDDLDCRETLADLLFAEGYEVTTADNGLEALGQLDPRPDVIVLDLMMPVMIGSEFIQRAGTATPVIVLSALRDRSKVSTHVAAWLQKPVDVEQLLLTIAELAGGAPARRN